MSKNRQGDFNHFGVQLWDNWPEAAQIWADLAGAGQILAKFDQEKSQISG